MSSAISQLSGSSSIHLHRRLHINTRSHPCPKVLLVRSQDARRTKLPASESKVTLSYTEDAITSNNDISEKTYSDKEDHVNGKVMSKPIDHVVTEEKRAAKIHDFCFGIPFVISAALLWKNFQSYTVTKKVSPTGLYAVIIAAMLCFYTYVMMSGGNPPPKKLKSSDAAVPS